MLDGFHGMCKICRSAAARHERAPGARDKDLQRSRDWYFRHRDYAREKEREYRSVPGVLEKRRARAKERSKTDPAFIEAGRRRFRKWYATQKKSKRVRAEVSDDQ